MANLEARKIKSYDAAQLLLGWLAFVIMLVLFRLILDFSYISFVSPVFFGYGFKLNYSFNSYLYSWLCFLIMIFFAPYRLRKVSDYFFLMAMLSVVAPLTSLYGLSNRDIYPVLVSMVSIAGVYLLANASFLKIPKLPTIKHGCLIALSISLVMVLYLIVWYVVSGAIGNINLDLSKVYEYRELTSEATNIGVLAYLNSWTYGVFCLFLISYFLHKKQYFFVFFAFVLQVFFFSVSAHKSILFYPFLIFGIWYYFRRTNLLIVMPIVFSSILSLALFLFLEFDFLTPASLFIRRVFFVPALLTYDYFEFFSSQPHIYWSNSVLAGIYSYPYDLSMPKLIGEFNGSGASANNGYISSGYGHAGLLGVFVYTFILGLVLRFLDVVSRNCEALWLALAMTVIPLRSLLISSDLFTVMLTHGLLAAIGLLLLMRSRRYA